MTYRRQECMGENTCSDIGYYYCFYKKMPPTTLHKPSIYQGFRKVIVGGIKMQYLVLYEVLHLYYQPCKGKRVSSIAFAAETSILSNT